jgi:hypothetical protein
MHKENSCECSHLSSITALSLSSSDFLAPWHSLVNPPLISPCPFILSSRSQDQDDRPHPLDSLSVPVIAWAASSLFSPIAAGARPLPWSALPGARDPCSSMPATFYLLLQHASSSVPPWPPPPAISLVAELTPAPATAPPSVLLLQALSLSQGARCSSSPFLLMAESSP